jgi:predicted transcriptional regulator
MAMSGAFMAMNQAEGGIKGDQHGKDITEHQRKVIIRCAYDSIPSMRRHVLKLLAKYRRGINTAAAASALNMPSESVKKYLYQLNSLEICDRKLQSGNRGHKWTMYDETYRKVVCDMEGITPTDDDLIKESEEDEVTPETISLDPNMAEMDRTIPNEDDSPGITDPFDPASF